MLSVRLFGSGQACYAGQPIGGFPAQQPFLVLSYLMLNRQQLHGRESVAALFWPDVTRETSLKALRNAVWRLRQLLHSVGAPEDQYLLVSDDRIAFATRAEYWLDIETFEHLVQCTNGQSGKALTAEQADNLEKAIALYSGDLLEGIYLDWCLVEREHLRTLYMNALSMLMAYHEAHANLERGLAYGETILARDPTREAIHRRMMRLYWLSGDRGAAIAQYHRCTQILQDELGIEPMAQTQRLYHLLLHDRPPSRPLDRSKHPRDVGESHPAAVSDPTVEEALAQIQRLQSVISKTTEELARLERTLRDIHR